MNHSFTSGLLFYVSNKVSKRLSTLILQDNSLISQQKVINEKNTLLKSQNT